MASRVQWTPEKEELLRKWYPVMDTHRLYLKLGPGYYYDQCKHKAARLKLQKEVPNSLPYNSPWRKINLDKFIEMYPNHSDAELAEMFNVSESSINKKKKELGLVKDPEFLRQQIEYARFKKGHVPANKGKRGCPSVSPHTVFRKGNVPINTLYDGCISVRKDKRGVSYKHIRISQGVWRMLHVHIWEQQYGPVPGTHVIVFADGDTLNCQLDNLECISKKEHFWRNSASNRLTDGYVANAAAGHRHRHLKDEILKRPDLIEVKRQSLILNRIKNEAH